VTAMPLRFFCLIIQKYSKMKNASIFTTIFCLLIVLTSLHACLPPPTKNKFQDNTNQNTNNNQNNNQNNQSGGKSKFQDNK